MFRVLWIACIILTFVDVLAVYNAHGHTAGHPSPTLTAHYNDPATNLHVHEWQGGNGKWNIGDNGKVAGIWDFDEPVDEPVDDITPPAKPNPIQQLPTVKSTPKAVSGGGVSTQTPTPLPDTDYMPRSTHPAIAPVVLLTNVLRISYLSFDNVSVEIGLTAYAPETQINEIVIHIKRFDFQTPDGFFGVEKLGVNEMRTVVLRRRMRSTRRWVDMICVSPENTVEVGGRGNQKIGRIEDRLTVSIRDSGSDVIRDSVTENDFDADGNRIGTVAGAPTLQKPKLVTMWAELKRK